jgi:hypothetical protein
MFKCTDEYVISICDNLLLYSFNENKKSYIGMLQEKKEKNRGMNTLIHRLISNYYTKLS